MSLTENEIESFQWVESYAAREQPGGRAARTPGGSLALETSENHTSASAHIRTPDLWAFLLSRTLKDEVRGMLI